VIPTFTLHSFGGNTDFFFLAPLLLLLLSGAVFLVALLLFGVFVDRIQRRFELESSFRWDDDDGRFFPLFLDGDILDSFLLNIEVKYYICISSPIRMHDSF
jgi:hypothetical protein